MGLLATAFRRRVRSRRGQRLSVRGQGVNRAIVVLRRGFNYGYHYPHINAETGCYATERELPNVLARMIRDFASFSPRRYFIAGA
jgi:hypothetical protein